MGGSEVLDCIVDFFTRLEGRCLGGILTDQSKVCFDDITLEGEDVAEKLLSCIKGVSIKAERHKCRVEKTLPFPIGCTGIYFIEMPARLYLYQGTAIYRRSLRIFSIFNSDAIIVIHVINQLMLSKELLIRTASKGVLFRKEEDILYVEANRNYTLWHCSDGIHRERGTLRSKLGRLSDSFIKVGISYCINVFHIDRIKGGEIYLIGNERIKIPSGKIRHIEDEVCRKLEIVSG